MIAPAECKTMAEVRAEVDSIDQQIVRLIARRFEFMDAAARIKGDRGDVRDEARKSEVLANVAAAAARAGIDPMLLRRLYEELVEASIAHEFGEWDRLRPSASSAR